MAPPPDFTFTMLELSMFLSFLSAFMCCFIVSWVVLRSSDNTRNSFIAMERTLHTNPAPQRTAKEPSTQVPPKLYTSQEGDSLNKQDGATAKTPRYTLALLRDRHQTHYLVHRHNEKPPSKWQCCTLAEARFEAETGYDVWKMKEDCTYKVNFDNETARRAGNDAAVDRQYSEIVEEEEARVVRHEGVGGEDLMEGIVEESDEEGKWC